MGNKEYQPRQDAKRDSDSWEAAQLRGSEVQKLKSQATVFGLSAVYAKDVKFRNQEFSYDTEINGQVVDLSIFAVPMLYAFMGYAERMLEEYGETEDLKKIVQVVAKEDKRVNGRLPEIGEGFGFTKE